MTNVKYVYWQDKDMWLGNLQEFPDYQTQGETRDELLENLKDIYAELTTGRIPGLSGVAERGNCFGTLTPSPCTQGEGRGEGSFFPFRAKAIAPRG